MKLVILYHPNDEFSTETETYVEECKKRTNKGVEVLSLDSQPGAVMADLYGLVDQPCVVVVRDDGQLMKAWQGKTLPIYDEVMGYLNN